MSHKITIEGNFGSAECLKEVLDEQGIRYEEKKEGNETYLVVPSMRSYGNDLKICVSNPRSSTMDSDKGHTVRGWYRDAMAKYVQQQLLMQGHTVISQEMKGQNLHLRVAVG